MTLLRMTFSALPLLRGARNCKFRASTFTSSRVLALMNRSKYLAACVRSLCSSSSVDTDINEFEAFVQSSTYVDSQPKFAQLHLPGAGHNVLIVQPIIKKGPRRRTNTTNELQLTEAVALIETLPEWKVTAKLQLSTENERRRLVFGKGNIQRIKDCVEKSNISAVFINLDLLTGVQHAGLQTHFGLPIYDRYTVVLNIFRYHAHTKEAKLQIALAEIPYYRARIWQLCKGAGRVDGRGQNFYERQKQLLHERELAIKRKLEEVKGHRQLLRQKRIKLEYPIVAVVGYTNAGKTSIIKQLTGDDKLQPRNQLFATLDVTAHAGRLPSLQTVLYMDTVGFISNIPTTLVASFASTLEDVLLADVIIHVYDLSHPDCEAQRQHVMETLEKIEVPENLLKGIIEVGNKIDLLPSHPESGTTNLVSCANGTGILQLQQKVESQVIENTKRTVVRLRVRTGGPEYCWLLKEGGFQTCNVDKEDVNYLLVDAILTSAAFSKFQHYFGSASIQS